MNTHTGFEKVIGRGVTAVNSEASRLFEPLLASLLSS